MQILGEEVSCRTKQYMLEDLNFLDTNPRIYHLVRQEHSVSPNQEEIYQLLASLGSTKKLATDIYQNGGLLEDIIVSDNTVIEGNSRLAAYKKLKARYPDDVRWRSITAKVIEKKLSKDEIIYLLGSYHIKSKTSWSAFEKSAFIYRALEEGSASKKDLSTEFGQGQATINAMACAYEAMNNYLKPRYTNDNMNANEEIAKKYSHFEALFRNKELSSMLEKEVITVRQFSGWVYTGVFTKAEHVRQLPHILGCESSKTVFLELADTDPKQAYENALKILKEHENNEIEMFHKALREFDNALNTMVSKVQDDSYNRFSSTDSLRIKRVKKNINLYLEKTV